MNHATQVIISYFHDENETWPESQADTWVYVMELSDSTGDGDYATAAEIGRTARDILEDTPNPDIPTPADLGVDASDVDWDAVGEWLLNSFREAGGDDEDDEDE